jgi:exopolyphosphatase/guanosine-5'-triphosphate,3'-diphosphate pyrophosphatase
MRIAILDLGSSSFHALVADVDDHGRFDVVLRRREMLHLAAATAIDGHIPAAAGFRALRAARTLRLEADRRHPDVVVASATSALRDAANGDHLLERLEVAARCEVRLLDGDEEAALAYRGATAGLGLHGHVLVADLGGGSLEVAVGTGSTVEQTATFPLGASRLTALHVKSDPPAHSELEAIETAVVESCGDLLARVGNNPPTRYVAAGGTARALARLTAEARSGASVNGLRIPTAALHALSRRLATAPRKERSRVPGMAAKRVDVLPAGSLILSCLADGLDTGAITISEWGMREGLLLEVIDELGSPLDLAR